MIWFLIEVLTMLVAGLIFCLGSIIKEKRGGKNGHKNDDR